MKEKLAFVHVLILIHMVQIGLILFRFPRLEAIYFGTNGWVSLWICFAAAMIHIALISPIIMLGGGRSPFAIMEQSLPRVILIPLYLILAGVWGMLASLAAKEYVHILKLVSFPTLAHTTLAVTLGLLAFYLLSKGVYNFSKAAMVFFLLSVWLTLILFYFHKEFEFARMTPFLFRDAQHIGIGFLNIYPAFLGYELIMLLAPYAGNRAKLVWAASLSTGFSLIQYTYLGIISFGMFSLDQLRRSIFPMLDLISFVKFPFVERIENLFYGFFLFANIITTVVYYWAASQAAGRIAPKLNPHWTGGLVIAASVGFSLIPATLLDTEKWLQFAGYAAIAAAFGLTLILLGFLLVQKAKGGTAREQT